MLRAFLINMDRSSDRLVHMRREFDRVGVPFDRVAAVDGGALSPEDRRAFVEARAGPFSEPWLDGEIGCFLSHFNVWQTTATGSEEAVAVFEDDVHLADDLKPLLASADWIPADADIVRLEANRKLRLSKGRQISAAPKRKLYRVLSSTWGAAGYIITRHAARRLVASDPALHRAVDVFLFKPGRSPVAAELIRYQVVPAVCVQSQLRTDDDGALKTMIGEAGRKPKQERARGAWTAALLPWKKRPISFRA